MAEVYGPPAPSAASTPNYLMYAQMGVQIGQFAGAFSAARSQTKMQRNYQEFRNRLSELSSAQSLNNVTQNEIAARDASILSGEALQIQALVERGKANVAAGAAGVTGNSVSLVMRDLKQSAVRANKSRLDGLMDQYRAAGSQRRQINVGRVLDQDTSHIPKPSTAAGLLGLGTNLLKVWDNHQTPKNKIAAQIGLGYKE